MRSESASTRRFGLGVLLALVVVATVGGLVEIGLRSARGRGLLPAGIVGTGNLSFDVTLHRAEAFMDERGSPDVVCLGSSMIKNAINPEVMEAVTAEITGRARSGFNFGVTGADIALSERLLDLVHAQLRPRLVLLEATVPAVHRAGELNLISGDIPQAAWFRYRSGELVLGGFLIDRLLLYRYFLRFRLFLEDPKNYQRLTAREGRVGLDGFDRKDSVPERRVSRIGVSSAKVPVAPVDASMQLRSLERILERCDGVVVVEAPLAPRLRRSLPGGEQGYRRMLAPLLRVADRHAAPFVQSSGNFEAPEGAWINDSHLNLAGAAVYSDWLARQLANMQLFEATRDGGMP